MTSDEAKKKFCPFVPAALGFSGGAPAVTMTSVGQFGAAYTVPMRQFNCQGDDCAMWAGDGCGLARRSSSHLTTPRDA